MIPYPFDGHYPDDDWLFPDDDGIAIVTQHYDDNRLEDDDEVLELLAHMMRAINA
jgi:hypothetical protein